MARRKVKIIVGIVAVVVAVLAVLAYQFMPPPPEPTVTLGGKSYSVADSTLGELLDYDEAAEVVARHFPGLADIRQLDIAKPLTLGDLQPFYPALISDAGLQAADAELQELEGSSVVVYTTGSTLVGVILDDPEARAIVDKHLPGFSTEPRIDQGRGFTLEFMRKFDPDTITEEVLANINADFKELAESRAGAQ